MNELEIKKIRMVRKMVFDFICHLREHSQVSPYFLDGATANLREAFHELLSKYDHT